MQKLTNEKARELLKELQYAKVQMGSLSIKDEYFKQALEDNIRMHWLVSKSVNVREPLLYGSHNIFWSHEITDEEDDYYESKLREQIDATMRGEAP